MGTDEHMITALWWRAALGLFLLAAAVGARAEGACATQPLLAPARAEVIEDIQPTLRWRGEPQAKYRVQVAVVLPEARVLTSHDLEIIGTSFTLPAPVPLERAGVKVLVSRNCPQLDAQDLQAQGAWFFIDVRSRCKLDVEGLATRDGRIVWQPVARASGYRVRLFRGGARPGEASSPLQEIPSASPWVMLPTGAAHQADVATVQAVCDGFVGPPEAVQLR